MLIWNTSDATISLHKIFRNSYYLHLNPISVFCIISNVHFYSYQIRILHLLFTLFKLHIALMIPIFIIDTTSCDKVCHNEMRKVGGLLRVVRFLLNNIPEYHDIATFSNVVISASPKMVKQHLICI